MFNRYLEEEKVVVDAASGNITTVADESNVPAVLVKRRAVLLTVGTTTRLR
jgi:hypothetical protein